MKKILLISSQKLEEFWKNNKDLLLEYDSLKIESFVDEPKHNQEYEDIKDDDILKEHKVIYDTASDRSDIYVFLLLDDNNIIGSIRVQFLPLLPRYNYLHSLFVNPEYRKRGYGSLLLDIAMNSEFIRKHSRTFQAEVFTFNTKSMKMFEKNGFKARRKYIFGNTQQNCIIYEKKLNNIDVNVGSDCQCVIIDDEQKNEDWIES